MSRSTRSAVIGALTIGTGLLSAGHAQAITFDTTFGVGGTFATPLSATLADRQLAVVPAPGGGVYAAGFTTPAGTDRVATVTKLTANGTLDTTFGTGGTALVNVASTFDPAPTGGTTPTGTIEQARGLAVQPDGKIVAVGIVETQPGAGDSRDTDAFALRLTPEGALDTTFSGDGIANVNPTNGRNTAAPVGATAPTGDQPYSMVLRPNGKIVIALGLGFESTDTSRTKRVVGAVQLNTDGSLDSSFGTGGVARSVAGTTTLATGVNVRNATLDSDGSVLIASYESPANNPTPPAAAVTRNRPFIHKFKPDGSLDATWGATIVQGGVAPNIGAPGVATGLVGGNLGVAEAYRVVKDAEGGWIGVGYGSHPTSQTTGADGMIFRFNAAGQHDQTFGAQAGGVSVYRYADVNASDQFRNLIALPDGRFAAVGRAGVAAGVTDAAVVIVKPDGTIDTSEGTNGAFTASLRDTGDEYYGVALSADRSKLVLAGFRTGTQDDGAVSRLNLTTAGSQGPAGPAGPAGADGADGTDGADGATPLASPGAAGPAGPAGPAGSAGAKGADGKSVTASNLSITCKLTGKKKNKISCAVKQKAPTTARASVRLRLATGGKVVASGTATAKHGLATVSLKGKAKAGTYELVATLPTASGKYRTVTQTLVLR